MFRLLSLLTGLLLLAASSLSCSRGDAKTTDNEGRIIVEFWHGMGSKQGRTINEIADLYNKSQKKYKIVPIYQGSYNALSQKLIASLYAGRNPAITQSYPGWTTRFFRYGHLEPMANFIAKDAEFREKALPDYYETMLEESTLPDPKTGAPTLATLPFNKSVFVMFVNQTRMEKLGWTAPPKTWDELLKLASDLTVRDDKGQATTYGFASRAQIEDLTVFAYAAGAQLMDEGTGKLNLTGPDVNSAMEFLHRLTSGNGKEGVGYVESGYLNSAFGSERIGIYVGSTASFSYNDDAVGNKFVWRAYPIPPRDEKTPGRTLMQGTNVAIFNNLPEEVKAGAWDFVKFLTSPEMTSLWARKTGYMPVRKSASRVPEFAEFVEKDVRYANALGALNAITFEPRVMYWESVRSILTREVESVLLNKKKTDEGLKAAETAVARVQAQSE